MALLSNDDEKAIERFYTSDPTAFETFLLGLNTRYGPSTDFEELLKKFIIEAPDKWLNLITYIRATYSSTTADVEKEVGKLVLEREKNTINLERSESSSTQTPSSNGYTEEELQEARRQGQQQASIEQDKLILWKEKIKQPLFQDWYRRAPGRAVVGEQLNKLTDLVARMTINHPIFHFESAIPLVIEMVHKARLLDGAEGKFQPTADSIRLSMSSYGRKA